MTKIRIQEIDETQHQKIIDKIQSIKKIYQQVFDNSNQIYFDHLIQKTEETLQKVYDNSISYQEKSELLFSVGMSWLESWKHYNHIPKAMELGQTIDSITNFFLGYTKLFLGISLVNENKVGNEEIDSKNVVSGFQLIAEAIDIFIDVFAISELKQINDSVNQIFCYCNRDFAKYFAESEKNSLITQLRGYCSLIMLRINQYLQDTESSLKEKKIPNSSSLWWKNIAGTFADDVIYDEAMTLGKHYRNSL